MKLISTEIVEKNGVKYQIDTYDNEMVIEYIWQDPNAPAPEPMPEPQDEPINQQELLESMALDLEYLVTLKNMEGGE